MQVGGGPAGPGPTAIRHEEGPVSGPSSFDPAPTAASGDRWSEDAAVAVDAARRAASVLRELREHGEPDLGAVGDRQAHQAIMELLAERRPHDPVLSEEGPPGPDGRAAQPDGSTSDGSARLWIVDPLDGTREFAAGLEEFAVHVALVVDGRAVVGAVALPAWDEVLSSQPAPTVPPRAEGPLRLAVSRSRPPRVASQVAEALGAELVPLGSAGFKVAAVVRGVVDAYVHDGGQFEWDSAAPVAVADAAGMHTSRLNGAPLRYGRPDPRLPDLVVCRRELADALLGAIAAVR
jgi:3'(2'), 5'-bisphosphate nucleotidase